MDYNMLVLVAGLITVLVFPTSHSLIVHNGRRWLSSCSRTAGYSPHMVCTDRNDIEKPSPHVDNPQVHNPQVDTSPKSQRFVHPQVVKMFRRAQYLIRNGDNAVAKKLLRRCLDLNPYDAHSWLALARLESKIGRLDSARALFTQSNDTCPNNVHILHAWGHFEQKHNNINAARNCWSEALALDPLNAYVCHALSGLEKRLRNFDRAKDILSEVTQKRPTAAICVSLADLERQLGHPEKSKQVLLDGLARCTKERSKLLLSLAWLEEDVFGNIEKARQLIAEAMRVDGASNTRVHLAKASLELRQGLVHEARETLRASTILDTDDGQHYTMWSTLELECGNVTAARSILLEGSRMFPGDQFLLQRWGTLEAKCGNFTKARELFERSVLIQPHAPTFVAWAILEENIGLKSLGRFMQLPAGNEVQVEIAGASSISAVSAGELDHPATAAPAAAEPYLSGEDVLNGGKVAAGTGRSVSELPVNATASAVAYAEKKFQEARHLFELGMEVDPQHGPVYHAFGNAELRRGNLTKAREIFSLGIDRNCSDITALYHALGLLEAKAGNSKAAGKIFRQGVELGLSGSREVDPGVGFLLHSLGMLELDARRLVEAKKVFETGIGLFPNHSQMLLGLALVSMRLGEHDRAKQFFRESVDADGEHLHAWQCWAIAEKQTGNIELARILFRQGLQRGPLHGALWQGYAVMEMQQGNLDIARSLFAQAVKRAPSHAQSYQAWACLEAREGNLPRAKELAWEGIRRSPTHAALWTVAGLVEDRLGHPDKAAKIFRKGIERFQTHGALYKVLGELEARSGHYTAARDIFAQGLQRDPYYAPVYHAAALLEAKLGNLEELMELHSRAKEYFRLDLGRVMSLNPDRGGDSHSHSVGSLAAAHEGVGPGAPSVVVSSIAEGYATNSLWDKDRENEDIIEKIRQLELATQETIQDGEKLLAGEYESDMESFMTKLEHQ